MSGYPHLQMYSYIPNPSASQQGPPSHSTSYYSAYSQQSNGVASNGTRRSPRFRAPTVEEALPFTPLTSIVPFSPDVLPYPSTPSSRTPNLFETPDLRRRTRGYLAQLEREASNSQATETRLSQALQKVQQLLRSDKLTEYQFASPTPVQRGQRTRQHSNGVSKPAVPPLNPFSKMVLDKTDVAYRYPTPSDSPPPSRKQKDSNSSNRTPATPRIGEKHRVRQVNGSAPIKNEPKAHIRVRSPKDHIKVQTPPTDNDTPIRPPMAAMNGRVQVKSPPGPRAQNKESVHYNEAIAVSIPNQTGSTIVPTAPAVFVPALPASSRRTEYQDFPELDRDINAGKKRKRDIQDVGRIDISIDHREKANAASQALQGLLDEVFHAEDQLQPDTSGMSATDTSLYFVQSAYNEDDTPILTHTVQKRLESAIQKVVAANLFEHVLVDDLVRIQKLCESTVSSMEALSLAVSEDANDSDIEEWVQRLELAENGLHGAKVLLRIMTAGREDRQLYSEDVLSTVLRSLEQVINLCIIPVVETRGSGGSAAIFRIHAAQKKPLSGLLAMAGRVLRLFGDLISKVDVAETVVVKVEYLSAQLIFVENAHTEKDSSLGTQRFETLRRTAMDVLAKIFARYPGQRASIFDEILSSLEKLPVTRQSARQFKMPDSKPIQLVSALLMRLVQTSGTRSVKGARKHDVSKGDAELDDEDDSSSETASPVKSSGLGDLMVEDELEPAQAEYDLKTLAEPLEKSAKADAAYVINYLVKRALTSTKSGDQPYRNLLDIFTEDFLSVLGQPDWPAAEVLLRVLLSNMFGLINDEKKPVPAKNLALDLMGSMGSGISDLQIYISNACKTLDANPSVLTTRLINIATDLLEEGEEQDINDFKGPYRVIMEFLHSQGLSDPQTQSARGYLLTQWAKSTLAQLDKDDAPTISAELCLQLRNMTIDTEWLQNEYDSIADSVSNAQARLASSIIALSSPFCKALPRVMNILVSFMTSQQPTLRSRSLKSVSDLLTKDPSILDRMKSVIQNIVRCTQDASSQVRDSALMLLAKCLLLKPSLEVQAYQRIIALADDDSVLVRKHSMKILKEIYLRNNDQNVQSAIATALMLRVKDLDESVAEMARQSFEELWITPFQASARKDSVQREIALKHQVTLIVKTVQRGESAVAVLDTVLQNVLSTESKSRLTSLDVCKSMVNIIFDEIIDNEERPDRPSQQHLAEVLTVFAKSEPKLFTSDQLRLLLPYLQNLKTTDSLPLFRSAVIVFRHVLPSLPSVERDLLTEVQGPLLVALKVLTKDEIPDTALCMRVIDDLLKTDRKLVRVMISMLQQVDSKKELNFSDPAQAQNVKHVKKYMELAGPFGKVCNFDEYAESFREKIPAWKGKSVSGLMIDIFCPFTRQKYPQELRETALESMATICQGWPQHYLRSDVSTAFELVFHNHDSRLEQIVLEGFKLFFYQEEKRSETGAEVKIGAGTAKGQERLSTSFIGSDSDAGATTIAQKFLPHVLRIAVESIDEIALTATQVIVSINRQGLVHPKESGPALVALETSTNRQIANIAFEEHKSLHHKHESMFEKEYMKAVQQAFNYQKNILHDPRGVTLQPTVPKLRPLFEVLKSGNSKVRKRFLSNLCSRVDFELPKLNATGNAPTAILFARFAMENLAFLDYTRVDEILHLVSSLEKLVIQGTGTVVAHAIELEILKVQIEESNHLQPDPSQQLVGAMPQSMPEQTVDPARLRQLAAASIILYIVWETRTHLRHLWGLQKTGKNAAAAAKPQAKDLNKPATKTPFVSGDKFLEKIAAIVASLDTPEGQMAQCKIFAELLSVDHELKVASEDDAEAELARQAAGYETPDEERETASNPSSTGKGRKRKGSVGAGVATPSKKRRVAGMTPKKARPGAGGGRRTSRTGSAENDDEDGRWD